MIYFRKHSVALALALLAGGVSHAAFAQAGAAVTLSPARSDAHALHNMMLGATRAGSRIVAVGAYGYIILSDDGGASYRQADKVPVDTTLTSVSFAGTEQGWAAGHGGVILHTADGGKTWALQRSDTSVDQPLFSVWFANANEGWAAGLWSLLLHTRDGGKSWQQVKLPIAPGQQRGDLNLLHIFPGRDGALFVSAEASLWTTPATAPRSAPSLPFSSSSRRSAVFLPMPGTRVRRPASCRVTAWARSATDMPERMDSAVRAPTPEILMSSLNVLRSSAVPNPNRMCASSRMARWVSSVTFSPRPGRL